MPNLTDDLYLRYYAFNYARQLKGLFPNKPPQLFLRYHLTNFNLGEQIGMDGQGNPTGIWDSFQNVHSFRFTFADSARNHPTKTLNL